MIILIQIIAVAIAIIIHEVAHAFISDRLGDPTARLGGRISLDPRKHYDPVGTTLLIVTALMAPIGAPVFGWAKPVMYDPYNLKNPKRDAALIAAAGPIINLLTAFMFAFLLKFFFMEIPILNLLSLAIINISVWLAIFNLIPIYPLDGSKILYGLLPLDLAREFDAIMSRYGTLLLIFLILPFGGQSALSTLISPLARTLLSLLLP